MKEGNLEGNLKGYHLRAVDAFISGTSWVGSFGRLEVFVCAGEGGGGGQESW
jgi:hypothetical protein